MKSTALAWLVRIESWLFDTRHGVNTRYAAGSDSQSYLDAKRNYSYLPTRPSLARTLLRDLPIEHYGDCTFVDFGSGKGRLLLLAAEFPFKAVDGIELNPQLNAQAVENVRTGRGFKRLCQNIRCLNIDAVEYEFPDSHVVLYFFNPFERQVLLRILERLRTWIERTAYCAVVITLYPEVRSLQQYVLQLQPILESDRLCIYKSC